MLLPILLDPLLHLGPKVIAFRTFITFIVIFYIWGLNSVNFPNYQPGTRQCNECRSEAPQRLQNWPKSDKSENIAAKCSQQNHTQVGFLNVFIFCSMLLEENLECTFDIDLFISIVYFRVYLLTSSVFFL